MKNFIKEHKVFAFIAVCFLLYVIKLSSLTSSDIFAIFILLFFLGAFLFPVFLVVLLIKKDKKTSPKPVVKPNIPQEKPREKTWKEKIDEKYENIYLPYDKRRFLSNHELDFYENLKRVADEMGYVVLSKVRLLDLVNITTRDYGEHQKYLNKVNRKHIDFLLAKPEDLSIVLLIELDDYSHDEEQYERDRFVEAVYRNAGYKLLRTRSSVGLEEKIKECLGV